MTAEELCKQVGMNYNDLKSALHCSCPTCQIQLKVINRDYSLNLRFCKDKSCIFCKPQTPIGMEDYI